MAFRVAAPPVDLSFPGRRFSFGAVAVSAGLHGALLALLLVTPPTAMRAPPAIVPERPRAVVAYFALGAPGARARHTPRRPARSAPPAAAAAPVPLADISTAAPRTLPFRVAHAGVRSSAPAPRPAPRPATSGSHGAWTELGAGDRAEVVGEDDGPAGDGGGAAGGSGPLKVAELLSKAGSACPPLKRPAAGDYADGGVAVAVAFIVNVMGLVDRETLRVVESPDRAHLGPEFFPHIYVVGSTALTDRSLDGASAYDSLVTRDVLRHVAELRFRPARQAGRPVPSTVLVACQAH